MKATIIDQLRIESVDLVEEFAWFREEFESAWHSEDIEIHHTLVRKYWKIWQGYLLDSVYAYWRNGYAFGKEVLWSESVEIQLGNPVCLCREMYLRTSE